jgi:hypothetical protein
MGLLELNRYPLYLYSYEPSRSHFDDLPAPRQRCAFRCRPCGAGTASSMAHWFSDVREVADDGWGYTGTLHMPGSVVAERRAEYAEAAQTARRMGGTAAG